MSDEALAQLTAMTDQLTSLVAAMEARQGSSVELAVDSKGQVKPTIKVYVGCTAEQIDAALTLALSTLSRAQSQAVGG